MRRREACWSFGNWGTWLDSLFTFFDFRNPLLWYTRSRALHSERYSCINSHWEIISHRLDSESIHNHLSFPYFHTSSPLSQRPFSSPSQWQFSIYQGAESQPLESPSPDSRSLIDGRLIVASSEDGIPPEESWILDRGRQPLSHLFQGESTIRFRSPIKNSTQIVPSSQGKNSNGRTILKSLDVVENLKSFLSTFIIKGSHEISCSIMAPRVIRVMKKWEKNEGLGVRIMRVGLMPTVCLVKKGL